MSSSAPHKKAPVSATSDDLTKLKKLIHECKFAMLATIDEEGQLHSRPMGVNGELETEGQEVALWFFTYGHSHKVNEMNQHDHQVNLAFSHPGNQTYLSLSGTGSIVKDRALMEKRWNPMLKAWFPNGLDEPDVALLKVVITKGEYWDAPSSIVAHAISFIKGQVTGTPADPAHHKAIKLDASGGAPGKAEKKEQTRGNEGKMQDV